MEDKNNKQISVYPNYQKDNSQEYECSICGKYSNIQKIDGQKRICNSCYTKHYRPKRECSICGNIDITEKYMDGKSICPSCYRKKSRPKYECSICGKYSIIQKVDGEKRICTNCYKKHFRPKRECSICGNIDITEKYIDGDSVCPSCYRENYKPKRICAYCGEESDVAKMHDNKPVCYSCYKKNFQPKRSCSVCGIEDIVAKIVDDKPICIKCYGLSHRPKQICSICGKEDIIQKIDNDKMICPNCYEKHYRPQKVCSICGNIDIIKVSNNGNPICAHCYNKQFRPKVQCSICGKENTVSKKIGSYSICPACYKIYYQPKAVCSECGKLDIIEKYVDGKPICRICFNKCHRPKGICQMCNNYDYVSKGKTGELICASCYYKYYRPKDYCSICGGYGIIHKKVGTQNICSKCYQKSYQPQKICSVCGTLAPIAKVSDDLIICRSCYNKAYKPKRICSLCGRSSFIAKIIDNQDICKKCYNKFYIPRRVCDICGSLSRIAKIENGSNICIKCYKENYAKLRTCSNCGAESLIVSTLSGKDLCNKCYKSIEAVCSKCGNTAEQYYHLEKLCSHCWYETKVQAFVLEMEKLFKNTFIYNLFVDYANTLLCFRKPLTVYKSLMRCLDLFRTMDEDNIQPFTINSDYLAKFNDKFSLPTVNKIRNFLIKQGLIKRDHDEESFRNYYNTYRKNLDNSFLEVFDAYSNFLIKIRKGMDLKGWKSKFTYYTCTKYLYTCYNFLDFVSIHANSVYEVNDMLVDAYIAEHTWAIGELRKFLNWYNRNVKQFRKLSIPQKKKHYTLNAYNEEEIKKIYSSISESYVSYREKMIALLLLVYIIRPKEILGLKLSDYKTEGNVTKLFVRSRWVSIDKSIARIIDNYIENERTSQLSFGSSEEWLLPGGLYDLPLSIQQIERILRKHGIKSGKAYATIISNLYLNEEVTPALLIQGLGINLTTAIKYYNLLNIESTYELEQFTTENLTHITAIDLDKYIQNKKFCVYILLCRDGSYYVGYTSNIHKRVEDHQNKRGCTYTQSRTPLQLVYTEEYDTKADALRREKSIKRLDREEKEKLITKNKINNL